MKSRILFAILFLATVYTSCKKDNEDIQTGVQPVDLKINLSYGLDSSGYTLPLENITVKVRNTATGSSATVNSDGTGLVTFQSLPAGIYDIDATVKLADTTYYRITGVYADDSVTFNASEKNYTLATGTETLSMQLISGTVGDWVIKQIYYAGSDRVDGALYRDQFIEIYNNTDHVLYADSLYIAQAYGKQSPATTLYQTLASGQLDWSKSVNMPTNIDANNDYLYTRSLIRIPGNGTTYPVEPGNSIIMAQTATNHKVPFTGLDGTSISVRNPDLTVDLSAAEFEAYYAPFASRPLGSDIDNPNAVNVDVLQYYSTDWIIDNNGRDSYIIFKVDAGTDVASWSYYNLPTVSTPSSNATKYLQVPIKYIIDAVEVQPNTAADRIPKKLGASLDAGFTYVPAGAYTSQSVIRKTAKTINGRIVLQDTNNSTEDFSYLERAAPKAFK